MLIDTNPSKERMSRHASNIIRIVDRYTSDDGQLFCWICAATDTSIIVLQPAPVLCLTCLPTFIDGLLLGYQHIAAEGQRILNEQRNSN